MLKLNIHEAKTHLSKYLPQIEQGETIVLCKRNVPIAEIRSLPPARRRQPEIGFAKGTFTIPDEFFEPLPDWLVDAFAGQAE